MKPWIGVVAAAAAIFAVPATALAGPDDPALLKFKLDNSAAVRRLRERSGSTWTTPSRTARATSVIVSAWVTDEQLQIARAHGFENVGVVHDKFNIDRIRAESLRPWRPRKPPSRRSRSTRPARRRAAPLPGSVRAQRADFYENNVGRYLSIEANADGVTYTGANAQHLRRPDADGRVVRRCRQQDGPGAARRLHATPTSPRTTTSTTTRSSGSGTRATAARPRRSIKISSSNGDVDTIAAKEWIAKDPPRYTSAPGFRSGFMTRYLNGQDAHQQDPRPRRPSSRTSPRPSSCPSRRAATSARRRRCSGTTQCRPRRTEPGAERDDAVRPLRRRQPARGGHRAGHRPEPGPDHAAADRRPHLAGIRPPGRQQPDRAHRRRRPATNQALSVSLVGNAHPRQPGHRRRRRDHARPPTRSSRRSTRTRTSASSSSRDQVPQLHAATASSRPAWPPRSATCCARRRPSAAARWTQYAIRIGKQRDGTKVGVFFYCQEHGNEIATSGVCLETAERLVRNYGTDPKTTELVDNLDIFIVPQINAGRRDALAVRLQPS